MPVLGVVVGTTMTLVVQSSSATIAVLQNFASQAGPDGVTSILGLTGAIPILLGDNIGIERLTAPFIASVGTAKRCQDECGCTLCFLTCPVHDLYLAYQTIRICDPDDLT